MEALVANAIHDAKNSLNTLNAWLDEAKRQAPCPALDAARVTAQRISTQLVELLAIYRHSEGSLRLAIDDHRLDDFLADVMAELQPAPGSSIRIEQDFAAASRLGDWAFDAYQVKFVLLDALRNALRHATSRVRFSLIKEDKGIRFDVADDGPGFPADVLAGDRGAMNDGSSGLGLVFAQLIAQGHATPDGRHGSLELANAGGATVTLRLP
jgi:signal transduction histidine kinase